MSQNSKIGYDRYKNLAIQGRQLHLAYLSICSFQVISTLSLTDLDIFLEKSVKLPIFQILVPMDTYFVVVPLILFPVSLYFFIHLDSLKKAQEAYWDSDKLQIYPWEMIDRMALTEKIPVNGFRGSYFTRSTIRKVRIFTGEMFLWNYLPFSLLLTAFLLARVHSNALTLYYVFSIVFAFGAAFFFKWQYYGGDKFRTPPAWSRLKIFSRLFSSWFTCIYQFVFLNLFLVCILFINGTFLMRVYDCGPEKYLKHPLLNLNLRNENLSQATVDGRSGILTNRDFRYGAYHEAVFDSLVLDGADFSNAKMSKASFKGASLVNCTFDNTSLQHADFSGANLMGASFLNARLRQAEFQNANLNETNLKGARMELARLRFAKNWNFEKITQAELLTGATLPDLLESLSDNPLFYHLFRTIPWEPNH